MKRAKNVKTYVYNVLIAIDQLGNTLLAGNPIETISMRAVKASARKEKWGCRLCQVLDFIDRNHCYKIVRYAHGKMIADMIAPEDNSHWNDFWPTRSIVLASIILLPILWVFA